jgi:TRAP-type C4-dicarboxylate transport system permease small subunit
VTTDPTPPAASVEAGAPGHVPALRAFRGLRALDQRLQRAEGWLCLAALLLALALVVVEGALRLLVGDALSAPWLGVAARHVALWFGLLGASLATARGLHPAVDVAPRLAAPATRRGLELAACVGALAVMATLLGVSLVWLLRVVIPEETPLFVVESLKLAVPRWPFLIAVPLALLLITGRLALRAALLGGGEAAEARPAVEAAPPPSPQVGQRAGRTDRAPVAPPVVPEPSAAAKAETERVPRATPVSTPPRTKPRPRAGPVGRSTDEIPVYRELADDEDLIEPDMRSTDSSDGIDPVGLRDVEDAVEAVAESARMRGELATPDPDVGSDEGTNARQSEVEPEPGTDPETDDAPARAPGSRPSETARVVAPSSFGSVSDVDRVPPRDATRRVESAEPPGEDQGGGQ